MSKIRTDLTALLENHRMRVASKRPFDVGNFAVAFDEMMTFVLELYDDADWPKTDAQWRKENNMEGVSETRVGKKINNPADEVLLRLMAFHQLLTDKIPGRNNDPVFGQPSGYFNSLAELVFDLYSIKARPTQVLRRLIANRPDTNSKIAEIAAEWPIPHMAEIPSR